MYWDKLPPQEIEHCRFRTSADPASSEGVAVCELLSLAGFPREACSVHRGACSACLRQFPPEPDNWNTVVASLVYSRADRALKSDHNYPLDRRRLEELRQRAFRHLEVVQGSHPYETGQQDLERSSLPLRELLPPCKPCRKSSVRKWAVGVLSAPRRQPTLETTVGSLIRAGWTEPNLFLDGIVRVPEKYANLPGVLREPRIGCWPNYYLALSELLMHHPNADALLVAEDDALFYDSECLREYLEQMLWPQSRPCIVSLYCSSVYSAPEAGWRPLGIPWTLGALAFVFPRRVAQELLLDLQVCDHRWSGWKTEHQGLAHTDIVIGRWAWRKRIQIWYPTPSLVQHIGFTSTLSPNFLPTGDRRADPWLGSPVSRAKPR